MFLYCKQCNTISIEYHVQEEKTFAVIARLVEGFVDEKFVHSFGISRVALVGTEETYTYCPYEPTHSCILYVPKDLSQEETLELWDMFKHKGTLKLERLDPTDLAKLARLLRINGGL